MGICRHFAFGTRMLRIQLRHDTIRLEIDGNLGIMSRRNPSHLRSSSVILMALGCCIVDRVWILAVSEHAPFLAMGVSPGSQTLSIHLLCVPPAKAITEARNISSSALNLDLNTTIIDQRPPLHLSSSDHRHAGRRYSICPSYHRHIDALLNICSDRSRFLSSVLFLSVPRYTPFFPSSYKFCCDPEFADLRWLNHDLARYGLVFRLLWPWQWHIRLCYLIPPVSSWAACCFVSVFSICMNAAVGSCVGFVDRVDRSNTAHAFVSAQVYVVSSSHQYSIVKHRTT